MPHFFISYAQKDTHKLALDLQRELHKPPDITCWMDETIPVGNSISTEISRQINACDYMIVLYSEDIHRHEKGEPESFVLKEIAYAQRKKKPIIPVMAQPTDPPLLLPDNRYIDYSNGTLTFRELVKKIYSAAQIKINPPPPPPPPPASKSLLPSPFKWTHIPDGKARLEKHDGLYGGGRTFHVPAFRIAKYPVTNRQFEKFMKAQGYQTRRWWTDAGWEAREKGWILNGDKWQTSKTRWTGPRFWSNEYFNGIYQPVVGISWYEAIAFCSWLSEVAEESITLLTEQQWQRAAQGNDGRLYPWGSEWDQTLCSNSVGLSRKVNCTSIVTKFEHKWDNAFEVVDMAGNTYEWCLTESKKGSINIVGSNPRIIRGGSFFSSYTKELRTTTRSLLEPHHAYDTVGFRISSTSN